MCAVRARLTPDQRRVDLLAWAANSFNTLPYDEVCFETIADQAGVSRSLLYHYFPGKRALFDAVVAAESHWLFNAAAAASTPEQTLYERLRAGVRVCVDYHDQHPRRTGPTHASTDDAAALLLRGIDITTDQQLRAIVNVLLRGTTVSADHTTTAALERDLCATVGSWLAFTLEMCRRHTADPTVSADRVSTACAHALLDAISHLPTVTPELLAAVGLRHAVQQQD